MTKETAISLSDPAVRKRIEEVMGMDDFPRPKGTANALIRLTQREGTSLAVMAHALKSDPVLSVRVIRVANGVSGGEHGPLVSLRDAVNVLGVAPVRSLALGFSLMETCRSGQCREFDYPRFWSQALARAIALQLLTSAREGLPRADAFSVGLLAGVGELILATVYPAPYSDLLEHRGKRSGAENVQLLQAEQEAFAITHPVLAASLLLDYDLPEVYAEAVSYLGRRAPENDAQGSAAASARQLLTLADHIGAICVAASGASRALMPELFELGSQLALPADQLIALCDRAAHEWREWGAMLEVETGPMPHFEECTAVPLPEAVPAAPSDGGSGRPEGAPPVVPQSAHPGVPSALPQSKSASPPETARGAAASVGESAQMCVLLVGDEARVRAPLRGVLAEVGYRVAEAVDGRQGLSLAIELQPQIMLVDLLATEIDGIELTRTLRQFKAGRSSYVVILSTTENDEKLSAAFAAGADGFLILPEIGRAHV